MKQDERWFPGNYLIPIHLNTEPGLLIAGSAEVFVVDRETGERRHLFSIETGGPILPVPCPPEASWDIVALTLEDTCVSTAALAPEWAAIVALDNWLSRIAEALSLLNPSSELLAVQEGRLNLISGQRICIEAGLNFVRLDSGAGSLSGARISEGSTVALVPGLWVEAAGTDSELEWTVLNNADESISNAAAVLRSTLDLVLPLFLDSLREAHQSRDREEALRLEQRRQIEADVTARAVDTLVESSRQGHARERYATGDPLLDALQALAGNKRISARPAREGSSLHTRLRDIAEASNLRTRSVLLSGKWWRAENGPLLAYRKDGSPVALLPVRPGFLGTARYEIFDPADGTRRAVQEKTAAELAPTAHMIYHPLPEDLSGWNLARFVLASRAKDLRTILLAGAGSALLAAALPVGTSILIGQAIPDADRSMVWQVAAGLVVAALGSALLFVVQAIATFRLQTTAFQTLQSGAWDHLLKLSPIFFRGFTVGQLRLRADGVTRIHQLLTADALRALLAGAASFLTLLVVFWYSPALGLIGLLCGGIAVALTWFGTRSMYRVQERWQTADEFLSGFVLQAIGGVSKLRVAGAVNRTFLQWARQYSRKQRAGVEIREVRDRIRLANMVLPYFAITLVFAWLQGNSIALGPFLACNAALTAFLLAITSASDSCTGLVLVANLWQRTRTILAGKPEVHATSTHPGRLSGEIAVENVTFRYRETGPPILDRITLHARPGECIAITGPSGSGKSTLLNLLLRFEVPQSGAITLDGKELSSLDITAVRRQIGVVTQDGRVMSGSIFQNICCGGLQTMEDAWEAARAAALAEDIEDMPMGMHTVVSDGGSNLSGGQRQRLLIARALILKPSILIFDEATSTLDNRTQAIVAESLRQMKATRILVAHRLSTIRTADRIYVIEKGRILQQGTYAQLSAVPGLFARLAQRQIG
jgi:NHLM bacteriocin system ABC transporter ATP-binding protein